MAPESTTVLVICGPTASGKTDLALRVATSVDAEIVSADSRQIYRELTVGTAKPDRDTLTAVPHHLINELSLGTSFSAGRFGQIATERINDIIGRGATPVVAGGSTLYVQALVRGLSTIPPVPASIRAEIVNRLSTEGSQALFAELIEADPTSAATMDHTKTQRLVRALEVLHGTGEPLSSYHAAQSPSTFQFRVVVISRDRAELYDRINKRVEQMISAGLVEEVRRILDAGHSPGLNSLKTIGYREPIRYLRGEIDHEEMVRLVKRNSRRYAKRQLTWFLRRPYDINVNLSDTTISQAAETLAKLG